MTRAKRVDTTQGEIVAALRAVGCRVDITSGLGDGFPDLVVSRPDGRVYLVEAKSPGGKLTPDEVEYILKRVYDSYRIFDNAQRAVDGVME